MSLYQPPFSFSLSVSLYLPLYPSVSSYSPLFPTVVLFLLPFCLSLYPSVFTICLPSICHCIPLYSPVSSSIRVSPPLSLFLSSLAKSDCYVRSNSLSGWKTAVERFVLGSLGSRVGNKCERYRKGHESHYIYGPRLAWSTLRYTLASR